MSYIRHPNFSTASQQQHQNMTFYGNGNYSQNTMPPYQNGSQFQPMNNFYMPSFTPLTNYDQGRFNPQPDIIVDTSPKKSKRQPTPLDVFSPGNVEPDDLTQISNSKPISTKMRVSAALTICEPIFVEKNEKELICENDDNVVAENEDLVVIQSNDETVFQCQETITSEDGACKYDNSQMEVNDNGNDQTVDNNEHINPSSDSHDAVTISPTSLTSDLESLSDMNKLEISTTEIQLNENSSSYNNGSENAIERGRLIYDRETLLQISKSRLCHKPELDCIEIFEPQDNKSSNLVLRLNFSNKSLVRNVNGYLPPHLRIKEECSLNQSLNTIRKGFKSILNKIVPQNFHECFLELKASITSSVVKDILVKDWVDCLIEEIFDKAIQEEGYSVTYANLCTEIVTYEEKQGLSWAFKTSLINRCKDMFETPLQEQLESVRKHWETKTEDEKDEQLKNLYRSDIEEQVKKAKDKYFGNIKFIAELYLHNLLKAKIINICVETLLSKDKEDVALLSLCKLLETCGKNFEKSYNDKMKDYIERMRELSDSSDLNSRIRFRLQDIIDMRDRNWTLRKIQAQKIIQPTTLDKVSKNDLEEKSIQASNKTNKCQTRLKKNNVTNSMEMKLNVAQNNNQTLGINSLRMSDNSALELKPSYGRWGINSEPQWEEVASKKHQYNNKSAKKKSQQNLISSPVTSRGESPCKVESTGRFDLLRSSGIEYMDVKLSTTPIGEDQENENDVCNYSISSSSTRELSPVNVKADYVDVIDSNEIFRKLLDNGDIDIRSWSQLTDGLSKTVITCLDRMMEKDKFTRNVIGDEFVKLIENDQLPIGDLIEGVKQFLVDVDDLKTDIPLIWSFLAEFLERLIVSSKTDINFFKDIFDDQIPSNDVGNCLALCLKYADNRLGHHCIRNIMKSCTWSFNDFVEEEQLEQLLKENDVYFLVEVPDESEIFDPLRNQLISLLPNDDEDINRFLDKNINSEQLHTEKYVYFVSACVFSYISDLSSDNIISFLHSKNSFFVLLLDRRSNLERQMLQALNSTAALLNEKGLLTAVVCGLADNILSYDAFQQVVQRDESSEDSVYGNIIVEAIRSMLDSRKL